MGTLWHKNHGQQPVFVTGLAQPDGRELRVKLEDLVGDPVRPGAAAAWRVDTAAKKAQDHRGARRDPPEPDGGARGLA